MTAWIITLVVFVFLSFIVTNKLYNHLVKKKRDDAEGISTIFFFTFGFGIVLASPFFVEYPSLVGRPSVATFDSAGEPVYHKWGLWTPPWGDLEVANVPYPDECRHVASGLLRYRGNTHFMVKKGAAFYFVTFDATICLQKPSRYYARKENRRQGGIDTELLIDQLVYDLLDYQESHLEDMKKIVRERCDLSNISLSYGGNCAVLDQELIDAAQARAMEQGFRLKVTSSIQRDRFTNK